jgi:hypothetical protein
MQHARLAGQADVPRAHRIPEYLFMNDLFMNDVGAPLSNRSMHDPSPTTSRRASQQRPLARGTSRHPSVKQFANCIEAHHQHAKPFVWTRTEVYRFGCASFLVEWQGATCPSLHSLRPAVIQAEAPSLSIMRRKTSQVGSMLRCDYWQARTEKPTWSIIPAVSSGTS